MAGLATELGARFGPGLRRAGLLLGAAALALVAADQKNVGRLLGQQHLSALWELPAHQLAALAVTMTALGLYLASVLGWTRDNVYLVDFYCFSPPERLKVSRTMLVQAMRAKGVFSEQNMEFMEKIIDRSGLGDETGLSDGILAMRDPDAKLGTSLKAVTEETQMVIFDVAGNLLKQANVRPDEVDIVIVSCSCFAPTPSMAAMLVNHFKMRRDVLTYNLSGMGCSSSLICVDMAKHLLKALPNKTVLVVNHENITQNWYVGNDRSMLVCNCLFRIGGAAALLSNRPRDRARAKYELVHSVRTHLGCEDDAFGCMGNGEDEEGVRGVFLRRNVIAVAGRALKANLTRLGPLMLPITELIKCATVKGHSPDFSRAFEHFLLHTGGRGVIDELEEKLHLTSKQVQPSKDTLYRFGNTSAASTWYILANVEHTSGVRRGDRLWQLGFGGGFKANSAVWRARRNIHTEHACWL
ncbi:hypothetical protein WJX81_004882 [Elliptochloris bilobata]|uniref:3-ketoacyl-CoA synthase n=1 Tax=Elliptochloris bilobata TaxID=381761 RepID=A0AAW1RW48_9CHLO